MSGDGFVHARSRFRSVRHPERFAIYAVHEPGEAFIETPGDHTLAVVREFRRVPLHASALGMVLFAARLGREAQVVATLAHYTERALSLYQPPYLLLARSLEQPGITMLLTGVQAASLLETGNASAFSVDVLLPELTPLLAAEPEYYAYAPEVTPESLFSSAVSPYAV
jgi:aryl-alcohol dehydrogenase-like predicted oxidoreductase